ncbi:MFS transporter [Jiangella rhizosphaerae]|uniref:MFS transporter n=1 Tax=Jiangella rhizosphaerae TaxID=2293569 RepID=A0A418KL87_9ACTN|nr:MFS transporter [Jiangella rhizosphaerae]RIQ18287.1 MFS transporter [Jiangella rhizosphaerae]
MAERTEGRGGVSPGMVIAVASLGAAVVTAGMQGIAPALPAIQDRFDLSPAEVALITSVYLLPSVLSALAGGILADRVGSRPVIAGSLLLFGLGGGLLLLDVPFWTLLAVRFAQGAAFGAVLSLTVGIIGDVAPSGAAAARGQSRRIIAMAIAEAVLPIVAGLLLAWGLGWSSPFALQLLALPLAVLAWRVLPPLVRAPGRSEAAGKRAENSGGMRAVLRAPAVVGVQVLAAMRFVFKFPVITYYPLLATGQLGLSPATVGVVMGASAAIAALTAALTEKLAGRWTSAQLIAGSLVVAALSVGGMAAGEWVALAIVAMLVFGAQDGVYGVAHNVLVTELAPPGLRSTYVGLTGMVRNVGKFSAPALFGAATLVLSLTQTFLVLGAAGLASVAVATRVAAVQSRLGPPPPPSS